MHNQIVEPINGPVNVDSSLTVSCKAGIGVGYHLAKPEGKLEQDVENTMHYKTNKTRGYIYPQLTDSNPSFTSGHGTWPSLP